ncbi:M10 family metallopeptidase C-terminal domain-containing protein [Neisseria perflava]|nr:M10 family metallopeptidase C-terminal domain-containing protein [Neisseria perflava]MCP1659961.1 plastocyanin [Neisseria perflava]
MACRWPWQAVVAAAETPRNDDTANNPTPSSPNTPSSETATDLPAPSVQQYITTRIYYASGAALSLTSADNVDLSKLEYRSVSPDPQAVLASYQNDSDGDGLIDAIDSQADMWNVSERDLRMFATLSYQTPIVLADTFNDTAKAHISSIDKEFENAASVTELTPYWTLLKAESPGDGLDYAIFANGLNADGSYDNVVVAFRGTEKFSFSDWVANFKLVSGNTPAQISYLQSIADYIATFKPTNLYSTGHSLGGYLAQFFAAYTVPNTTALADSFSHSSLFNPAVLTVDSGSSTALKTARSNTDEMVKTVITDNSDVTEAVSLYRSNSYVIKGEWVSSGPSALLVWIRLLFSGLGTYENANIYDVKSDEIWGKHNMSSFYENSSQLESVFSRGSRIDSWYANPYTLDTDNDGFSDGIEAKLNTAADDPDSVPYTVVDDSPISAVVQTVSADGTVLSAQTVELVAERDGENVVYRPSESSIRDIAADTVDWEALATQTHSGTAVLSGTSGDDIITGSNGNDRLWGNLGSNTIVSGAGEDVIVFTASDIVGGATDHITDFDTAADRIDLSGMRALFSDHTDNIDWSSLFVASTEQSGLIYDN